MQWYNPEQTGYVSRNPRFKVEAGKKGEWNAQQLRILSATKNAIFQLKKDENKLKKDKQLLTLADASSDSDNGLSEVTNADTDAEFQGDNDNNNGDTE